MLQIHRIKIKRRRSNMPSLFGYILPIQELLTRRTKATARNQLFFLHFHFFMSDKKERNGAEKSLKMQTLQLLHNYSTPQKQHFILVPLHPDCYYISLPKNHMIYNISQRAHQIYMAHVHPTKRISIQRIFKVVFRFVS